MSIPSHDPATGRFMRGGRPGPGRPRHSRLRELHRAFSAAETPEAIRAVARDALAYLDDLVPRRHPIRRRSNSAVVPGPETAC